MFRKSCIFMILTLVFFIGGYVPANAQDDSSSGTLDETVVTASKQEESKREVTTNITVISGSDIQKSTATSMTDLMVQNGLQVYSPGGGASTQTLWMRGYGGSSMSFTEANYVVMILLNGHRTSNADLALMNLGNIDRIEIIRGPAAVQYGTSAMGGVVNIITKRGEGPITARVEVGMGSDGRQEEKLALSGGYNIGQNIFDFAFAFSHSSRGDMHVAQANNHDFVAAKGNSIWPNTSFKSKFGIDGEMGITFMDNHRIGFHIAYTDIEDGLVPGAGFVSTINDITSFSVNNNYTYNYTLSYEGKTSDDHFNWFLNYTHGRLVNQAEGYSSYDWPEISWIGGNYTDLDQIQAQVSYDSLDYVALTTGIDYYKYDVETYGYSATKGSITDLGIYVLGKIRLLDSRLIFTVGGRYDSYKLSSINVESRTEDKFVPSVGVAYSPFDFIKFRANYSVGYAVPSPQQLLGDGADQYLAAPDLKPQESKTWEVGVDISYDFIDASLTYFHSIFKDKIISRTYYGNSACQQSPCYQFINLDEAVQAGIEFSLKFDIGKALNQEFSLAPYVSATWMTKRENKDPDDVVSIDPDVLPNMPRLMLSYGITFDYPDQNLSARLNATYFGKFYTQNWDDGTWAGPWVEYGGFTSVDFSISKRILDFQDKGNVELKVDVNNMFNQYKGPTLNYPIQARNFYVGLVYNY